MTETLPPLSPAAVDAAVLLVLLAGPDTARLVPGVSPVALAGLQQQLGAAVRVLRIDATSHPSVVSSFHATDLPCFVLVHHGIELWRDCGHLDVATMTPLVLSKLHAA